MQFSRLQWLNLDGLDQVAKHGLKVGVGLRVLQRILIGCELDRQCVVTRANG